MFFPLLFFSSLYAAQNKVVANVNGETILASDYWKAASPILEDYENILKAVKEGGLARSTAEDLLKPQGLSFPANEKQRQENLRKLKDRILQKMIDDRLLLQAAKEKKLRATKREIEKEMEGFKKRFERDEDGRPRSASQVEKAFQAALKEQGVTLATAREKMGELIITRKLIQQEIWPRIQKPTDEEIEEFYRKNPERVKEPEKVRIRHILVRVPPGASPSEKAAARSKIQAIQRRLAKTDFATVASEMSEDPGSKEAGGDLGWIVRGQMVPAFEEAAFKLRIGQTSGIVETPFGFHILRNEGRQAAATRTLAEVRDIIAQFLFAQRQESALEEYVAELRAKARIEVYPVE